MRTGILEIPCKIASYVSEVTGGKGSLVFNYLQEKEIYRNTLQLRGECCSVD